MNGRQTAVLWMGLLLIVARMFGTNQWTQLWTTVTKPGTQTSTTPTASTVESQMGAAGTIPVSFGSSGSSSTANSGSGSSGGSGSGTPTVSV